MAHKLPKFLGSSWIEALVRLGYGDLYGLPVRSLYFRTEYMSPLLAEKVISSVYYTGFDGPEVAAAVHDLSRVGFINRVMFGREDSPVLYLSVEGKNEGAVKRVEDVMLAVGAEEADRVWGEGYVRAWWGYR